MCNTVLLTGASGFIGKALTFFLEKKGYKVVSCPRKILLDEKLVTVKNSENSAFEGLVAVIHLAGESLSNGIFWTKRKKKAILKSRVDGTQNLVHWIAQLRCPPRVFISASAVGYYGDRQREILSEDSSVGKGFLPFVCKQWEEASFPLKALSIRVVYARLGYVLSLRGGLLKSLIPLFRFGLGGKIGGGQQFVPWVMLEDVLRVFAYIIETESIQGAVNVVAPHPVTQEVFAKELARTLRVPCFFSVPKWLLWGEKSKTLCLPSLQVIPYKLEQKYSFVFAFPELKMALQKLFRLR